MIALGIVQAVDDDGVYVLLPGSKGQQRGPYWSLDASVKAGDRVLVAQTDDGEAVVVGRAPGSADGVFNVRDYGATGDGTADDTAAVQAAIDAAHAEGGGVVILPHGTYKITGDGLQSKSASIVGAGARSSGKTTASAVILQGSEQTGPILSVEGTGGNGIGGLVDYFFGVRQFTDFTIRGDGVNDENGLRIYNSHMIVLRNIALRNCRGVPLYAERSFFVTVDDCQIQEPVDVATHDTHYCELLLANSWRINGLLLRGLSTTAPTVGADGAMLITDDGAFDSTANDLHILTEYMTLAEGSLGIINHRGNRNRIQMTAWDTADYGTVATPWAAIHLAPANVSDYGGNTVTGVLQADYTNRTCYGVNIEQDNNAVVATAGYYDKSVRLGNGVQHCAIELLGSVSGPNTGQIVDDSGNATNGYRDALTARHAQTSLGFFGADPVAQPEVTGSAGGNAALASLLTALDALGLITDSSS